MEIETEDYVKCILCIGVVYQKGSADDCTATAIKSYQNIGQPQTNEQIGGISTLFS